MFFYGMEHCFNETMPNSCYVMKLKFVFFMLSSRRQDISDGLRKLRCRSLIFVGENSPFHSEALDMTSKLDRRCSALVEVCITGPFASLLKFGLSVYPGLWNHVLFIETIPYRFRHVVQW